MDLDSLWFHSACCREHGLGERCMGTKGRGLLMVFPHCPRLSPCQSKAGWAQGWKMLITQGRIAVGFFQLFSPCLVFMTFLSR